MKNTEKTIYEFEELWNECMQHKKAFSPEAERHLFESVNNGNIDEITMGYLWLPVSLAASLSRKSKISMMELAAIAVRELSVSIQVYNPCSRDSFFQCASAHILEHLEDVILTAEKEISGVTVALDVMIAEKITALEKNFGRIPTLIEVMDAMDLEHNKWLIFRMPQILQTLARKGIR